ncbi:hypothetical protein Xhom_04151 [Xenorhabdus hominickii]|uniref:Uncharacterized protein n=1 Tax=Xenorhabdus hominickii TaxID=351679 RepID=A0A2G0Q221_XENHO|nr:hypothetical protein Xhom_04151 [Xenorhabdus hominickii]
MFFRVDNLQSISFSVIFYGLRGYIDWVYLSNGVLIGKNTFFINEFLMDISCRINLMFIIFNWLIYIF